MLTPSKATIAPALKERLSRSPRRVMAETELAADLEKAAARSASLREVWVESIKDRAAREVQRVEDAEARRRRIAAGTIDKVQRKLLADETKVLAKKEAKEAKRQAERAHRSELAQSVAVTRAALLARMADRASELRMAEEQAAARQAKNVEAVHAKSARVVQHALAVKEANEEKERLAAVATSERLASRLNAAECRRALQSTPSKASEGVPSCTYPQLAQVLNDAKVTSETKASAAAQRMERATSKREELIQAVVSKAASLNVRAADKAAAAQHVAKGTDAATLASKAALYDRLLNAEVARAATLKQRAEGRFMGDTTSMIVVRVDKKHPTMPPAELVKRLSTVNTTLVRTAKARQLGAAARRQAAIAKRILLSATRNSKRAAGLGRLSTKSAVSEAAIKAMATRAMCNKALQDGLKAHVISQERQRFASATQSRKAAEALRLAIGEKEAVRCQAADERHTARLRKVAKKGVQAVRSSAVASRRAAAMAALQARGEVLLGRLEKAVAAKESILAVRIAKAKLAQSVKGWPHSCLDTDKVSESHKESEVTAKGAVEEAA